MNKCRICGEEIAVGRFTCSKLICVRRNFRRNSSIRRVRNSRTEFIIYGASGKQLERIVVDETTHIL